MVRLATPAALSLFAISLASCAAGPTGRAAVETPAANCQDVTIPIYFEPDVFDLTPEGRRVLAAEAQAVKGCRVESVRVVGLADAVGDPAANLELSKRRAASVADAILKAGLPAADFEVTAAGQAGAIAAGGEVRPVRRRADVTLKLSRP
jgi:outer membrane protein OmpA-like peptidoglycan-associated protein